MKYDLKYKIPLTTFIVGCIFITVYIFFDTYFFRQEIQKVTLKSAENKIYEREMFLNNKLHKLEETLFAIRQNLLFENYLNNKPNSRQPLAEFFRAMILSNNEIMQLRFLDNKGMEKIRFDRIANGVKEIETLQDKSSRYYFKDNIHKPEKIIYSKFDLNIENGKVEIPFNPTARIILPVKENNIDKGILIINIFGQPLLENLFKMPNYDGILIDKDGYILYHYESDKSWSKYKQPSFTIENKFLTAIKQHQNQNKDFVIKKFNLPFENELYMILQNSQSIVMDQDILYKKKLFISLFIFTILILIATSILYFVFKRIEKQEEEISVLSETQHIQEKILTQQTKMAAMGEMIANIAHQWRQPLTALSMQIIAIEFKLLKKETITQEFLEDFIAKANGTIQNMSKTIEDFSNFFNPNKPKQEFDLQQAIHESLNIVSKHLKDNNISIIFENQKSYMIYGHRNELIQVFINLINNSKDAIQANKILNGNIAIKIIPYEDKYILEFLDNAGGIPQNILDRIFEPYFTTKFKEQGTGIGLYMCKMIIKHSFKGTITFENKQNGALCIITLPIITKENQ